MSSPRRPRPASPRSSRTAPAPPTRAAASSCGCCCASRSRPPTCWRRPPRRPASQLVADRSRCSSVRARCTRRSRARRATRPCSVPARGSSSACCSTPTAPSAGARACAPAAERAGARLALGRPFRCAARDAASRGRRALLTLMVAGLAGDEALASAERARAGAAARRRSAARGRVRRAPARAAGDGPGRGDAGEPRADAARLAALAGPAQDDRASSWGCTRRRCATGWRGCASCSASQLDDPDGRFELELALRLRPFAALAPDRPASAPAEPPRSHADGRHRQRRRPRCAHAAACRRARARRGCRRC